MKFEITEEMRKRIFVNTVSILIPILLYLLLNNMKDVKTLFNNVLSVLGPFLIGIVLAFVMYQPEQWLERKLFSNTKLKDSKKRVFASLITFLCLILFIVLLIYIIVPNVVDSIEQFVKNFSSYSDTLSQYAYYVAKSLNMSTSDIEAILSELNLSETITNALTDIIPKLAVYSYSFVSGIVSFLVALVSGFYILLDKESLVRGVKKLNYAILNDQYAKNLNYWINDVKVVFQQYIVGNIIDSSIIGVSCYIGVLIMKMPYAPMIGLIVGITNLIPVFGPFLGAIPVIVLLLLIDPIKAVMFAIFILILQQIDGNVIKPIVLGDKMGMSGFWILFSVTIGGGLFGIIGMFLGVPIFALIYAGLKEFAEYQLKRKHIEVE